jgi:predicted acyl esterase
MTGDTHFQTVLEKQAQIKDEALKLTQWKNTRSIHDKKARFPPFKQGTTLLKAGTQIQLGGLRLPIDITMHESVATTLSDGTTLYSDIFLPGRHSNPIAPTDRPVPALIAW